MADLLAWYELHFGSAVYPLLMCREDGAFPHIRFGSRDYAGNELTVFTALRFPG